MCSTLSIRFYFNPPLNTMSSIPIELFEEGSMKKKQGNIHFGRFNPLSSGRKSLKYFRFNPFCDLTSYCVSASALTFSTLSNAKKSVRNLNGYSLSILK